MKTANVSTKRQAINLPTVLKKVSVNLTMSPFPKKATGRLSIQGYEFRQWIEHLNGSNGAYFLDMEKDQNVYSLHFKHHHTGKLMELEYQVHSGEPEDPRKDFLEALVFDLSLFPEEPILTFDCDKAEAMLRDLASIYYEYTHSVDSIVGRLVNIDLKAIFETGVYQDTRINDYTIDGIYQALYPDTRRRFKEQASYGLFLIYLALENVFNQIIGKGGMLVV